MANLLLFSWLSFHELQSCSALFAVNQSTRLPWSQVTPQEALHNSFKYIIEEFPGFPATSKSQPMFRLQTYYQIRVMQTHPKRAGNLF